MAKPKEQKKPNRQPEQSKPDDEVLTSAELPSHDHGQADPGAGVSDEPVDTSPASPDETHVHVQPDDGKVIIEVPKAFQLQVEVGVLHLIKKGIHRVPRAWAENWYSKANGVIIHEAK